MFLINKLKKKKIIFFLKYCLIGIISIGLELILRKFLLKVNINQILILILPLTFGIIFAFISNITFNFNIPRYYYKKSFFYFSIISISSFSFQYFLSKFFLIKNLKY